MKHSQDGTDQMAVLSTAASKCRRDDKVARVEILPDGVDVSGTRDCRTALIYARWNDGS